jgi:RHS repeat-associated protein
MGPYFEASVLRMEVFESNFCLQLQFEYQASGPLVQQDSPTKQVLEIVQSWDVVFSSDRSSDRFTGKPVSQTTGLYYDYKRWYDPTIGRFISADQDAGEVSDPQSLNRYVYAFNNPARYVDPNGAAPVDAFNALVLGAVTSAFGFVNKIYGVRNVDLRRGDLSYWKSDVYWRRIKTPEGPHTLVERVQWIQGPAREKGVPLVKIERPGHGVDYYHLAGREIGGGHPEFRFGGALEGIYKYGSKISAGLFIAGVGISAWNIYSSYESEGCLCQNTVRTVATEASSWALSLAGAEVGFEIGCLAGPVGCLAGALGGAAIGGLGGQYFG